MSASARRKISLVRKHDGQSKTQTAEVAVRDPNALCQQRLAVRLQRLNERGGRRSSGKRKRLEVDATRSISKKTDFAPAETKSSLNKSAPDSVKSWGAR